LPGGHRFPRERGGRRGGAQHLEVSKKSEKNLGKLVETLEGAVKELK
jgi:hypothetical protein